MNRAAHKLNSLTLGSALELEFLAHLPNEPSSTKNLFVKGRSAQLKKLVSKWLSSARLHFARP